MPSTRTNRNARRAVARLRSSGKLAEVRRQNRSRSGGSADKSGKGGGKVGAGPRLMRKYGRQINRQAGREALGKRSPGIGPRR